jgi:hypothetical protein
LNNKELTGKVRKQFAIKKREALDLGRRFIANSLTLSTRKMVDVLKAMADSERESKSVSAFFSRLVLLSRGKCNKIL